MRRLRAALAPCRGFRPACRNDMVCEVAMGRPWVSAGSLLVAGVLAAAGSAVADDAGPLPLAESSLHAVALRGPVAASPQPAFAGSPDDPAIEAPELLTRDDIARLGIGVVPVPPEPRPVRLSPPPEAARDASVQTSAPLPVPRPALPGSGVHGTVPLPAARPPSPGGLHEHGIAHGPVELAAEALVAVGFTIR
jgi:hypothetical protein